MTVDWDSRTEPSIFPVPPIPLPQPADRRPLVIYEEVATEQPRYRVIRTADDALIFEIAVDIDALGMPRWRAIQDVGSEHTWERLARRLVLALEGQS